MRELEAALQEHLGEVAQAQLVPQPPQHDEQDQIGGIFQIVERRPCTLVERSLAGSRNGTSDNPARFSWSVFW